MKVKGLIDVLKAYNPDAIMEFTGFVFYPQQNSQECNSVDMALSSVYTDSNVPDRVFMNLDEVEAKD